MVSAGRTRYEVEVGGSIPSPAASRGVLNEYGQLFISMKDLLRSWKKYLIQEDLGHYNVGGKMRLYHYAKEDEDSLTLDPEYFLSNRSAFTRNDFGTSGLPRVFFYTNIDHAEAMVKSGRTLYSTFVSTNKIYDLDKDPEGLLKKSRGYADIPRSADYDRVLRSIAGKPKVYKYGGEFKNLREPDKKPYTGAYYEFEGGMHVVVWFEPIEVYKFNPENVNSPADNTEVK